MSKNKGFNISSDVLNNMNLLELRELARELGIPSPTILKKGELIKQTLGIINGDLEPATKSKRGRPPKQIKGLEGILEALKGEDKVEYQTPMAPKVKDNIPKFDEENEQENISEKEDGLAEREGVLEIHNDGYGFLRADNYEPGENDVYISNPQIKRFSLKRGDLVRGKVKNVTNNRYDAIIKILSVNGIPVESFNGRRQFEELVPIYPKERLVLETKTASDVAIRSIDLLSPIGKGQRAMIVSPPKAGKTTLLKKIAYSISINYPEVHLIVLLIDERPEEVTDMQRSIKGEVIFSTFDELPEHHTRIAELVLARAKRLVENGKDVVIVLDSLTRLARAYNLTVPPTGRTLSGGIDPGALYAPKKFFGSARNIEDGGSLTIIATALIDTGSRMDDVIYEEFKGTGNMEVHLNRNLSEKRIFPAIDLYRSGTRKEELLLTAKELEATYAIRKLLSKGDSQEATEQLINLMLKSKTNQKFIDMLAEMLAIYEKSARKIFN
ncbi:MAG: transcription termination factor Rho [Clostridia bacterium]|nr:transcription termination factor Rho [Clostridia bacterium]